MKRIFFILPLIVCGLSWIAPTSLWAATTQQVSGTVILAQEQQHFGNLFAFGNKLRLEGEVHGDVYVAANELVINGVVHGDVLGIARKITINGSVDGNIRVMAQGIELYGTIERNVSLLADQATVRDTATIKGTLTGIATNLTVLGSINDSLEGKYTNILIASDVGRNVDVTITNDFDSGLHVLATARINGDLQYTALQPAQVAKGAVITGNRNYNMMSAGNERLWFIDLGDSNWWLIRLGYFASVLLFTLLVWRLSNKRWHEVVESMLLQPRKSLWYGLLSFVFIPVVSLLLVLSLVGLPLGLVGFGLYLMMWYFYPAWACLYVTTLVGQRLKAVKALPIPWQIMLGLMIIIALTQLPFVGIFFSALMFILTTGALTDSWLRWMGVKKS